MKIYGDVIVLGHYCPTSTECKNINPIFNVLNQNVTKRVGYVDKCVYSNVQNISSKYITLCKHKRRQPSTESITSQQ